MCGIAGAVRSTSAIDGAVLATVADQTHAMARRGPDAEGLWHDGEAAFGHRRLTIIDRREAANQPAISPDGRYVLVFNGEIYNFRDLAGATATSDTLSLVAGDPPPALSPQRLRGMFAYALWDRAEHRLTLARDRFGMKPLYIARQGDRFGFASTARAAASLAGRRARPDPRAIASFLRFGAVQAPGSIYTGVDELEPGCTATLVDGVLSTRRYWSYADERDAPLGPARLRAVLRAAVETHAVSDQPLALYLSGGLDSAIIATLAAELDLDITALTLSFPGSAIDEAAEATRTASALGLPHQVIRRSEIAPDFDTFFASMDQPTIDGMNVALVSQAAHEAGFRVALTGIGADELFGGYANFRRIPMIAALNALTPDRLARHLLRRSGGNTDKAGDLVTAGAHLGAVHAELRSVFSTDDVRRLTGQDVHASAPLGHTRGPVDLVSRLEIEQYLRNTLLRDADVFAMAHSVEIRTPFVDHHVLAAARSIPATSKLRLGKRVLADAVGGLRMHELMARPKTGFTVPHEEWLRGPLADRVDDLLNGPLADACDVGEIARHLAAWRKGHCRAIRIWALVVLDGWLRSAAQAANSPISAATRRA